MDQSTITICQRGDLLTSIAMIMDGCGISIEGNKADPRNLNNWLRKNGGYLTQPDGSFDINKSVLSSFGFKFWGEERNGMNIR